MAKVRVGSGEREISVALKDSDDGVIVQIRGKDGKKWNLLTLKHDGTIERRPGNSKKGGFAVDANGRVQVA